MRKKNKNRNALIRVLLCITVLTVTGAVLYPLFSNKLHANPSPPKPLTPDETAARYFSLVGARQYGDLYAMLSEQSKAQVTEEDFTSRHKNIYDGITARNIAAVVGQVSDLDETRKAVDYTLRMNTIAGEIEYTNRIVFSQNENKEYRIEWSPQTIFPNLTWNDKVRVNTLAAKRGCIYDRTGEMLAGPGIASSVGFVPGKMSGDTGDIAKVAALLETTPETITKKLSASYVKDDTFVLLKTIPRDAYELEKELLGVKGILISNTTVRYYPLGEKASHLVGYIQGISAEELETLAEQGYNANSLLGKAGLEKIYEEQLRANDGYEIVIVDEKGNVKNILARKNKADGQDIVLTIDSQMQSRLYDLFSSDKSCSVALNPKTGEVLALVSTPTYNANDFVLGMTAAKWASLNENENKPMFNRFKAALCPGSTFKSVTAAIGINTGVISPADDFGHSGLRWRKDESWGGYYVTTTKEYSGAANIENALMYSDNIYFSKAALKIGAGLFAEQLKGIGFEERIPFEFGLYSSTISATETFTSEIQLADSGFGQGQILMNPVHLASVYSAFVNNGSMIKPHLLRENTEPLYWKEQAFTPETAKAVRDSLVQVVERGTATDAKIKGLTLGGKTGTAEVKQSKNDTSGTELGWFVLFNADERAKNQLMVVTMVEDVKGRGGSHYVSSRVKKVFE